MTHERRVLRAWTLVGMVVGLLALLMLLLARAQAAGPGIGIVKQANRTAVYSGDTVTYTYQITNSLAGPLSSVNVSDNKCFPVSFVPGGDTDGDGKLDPGETWTYRCATALVVDTTNTAYVNALDGSNPVSDSDTAFVDVIAPSIAIAKVVDRTIIYVDDTVVYTYTVTNPGDDPLSGVGVSDDKCSPVNYVSGDDSPANSKLDPGETWTYTCSMDLSADTTNEATASGTDSAGNPVTSTPASASVNVIAPSIAIAKVADPAVIYPEDTVVYTYTVTNPGDDPLSGVGVSDDKCGSVTVVPGGDTNGNSKLDPGETWTYTCSMDLSQDTTNVATASGTDSAGNPVTAPAFAFVNVIAPQIQIIKTANPTLVHPETIVNYTYIVTNPGDDPLSQVSVGDDKCSPVTRTGGDTNGNSKLDLTESWMYACSTALTESTTNTATANAKDSGGNPVTPATDTASVTVIHPAIAIDKTPDSQMVLSGTVATFSMIVTNPGDDPLSNVTVSDDKCSPVTAVPGGDTNGNNKLDPGETWTYGCSKTMHFDDTNTATAEATDSLGSPVTPDTDTASVNVVHPSIAIAKTPDLQTVPSGGTASFTIYITNTGDVSLASVTVSDPLAPLCNKSLGTLGTSSGSRYAHYGCTLGGVTDNLINSATVVGTVSQIGVQVEDSDTAQVGLEGTEDCPTGMTAYWRLDEPSGPPYNDYYSVHDGVCAGGCPTPVAGHVGGGQAFSGGTTGIDIPVYDDSFNWDAGDSFSFEYWMRTDATSTCAGTQVIIGRDAGQLHWWSGCVPGGLPRFYLRGAAGTGNTVTGSTDLTDGAWHHVVAMRAKGAGSDEIRLYVDGALEDSKSVNYSAGFGASVPLNIGWLNLGDGYHFGGILDEVAVYSRALSADEVRLHREEGVVGRWYCQGEYAPIILSTPVTQGTAGQLYSYDVEAIGNPVPTYALNVHPTGMVIDGATGVISWTPTLEQDGVHNVEVAAINSVGSTTQSFTISVVRPMICPDDMLAYWKLDETSGSTYKDKYDGHDGGCAPGKSCPTPTSGYIEGAQAFTNVTSPTGIDVPSHSDFDWAVDESFSIEFWMRLRDGNTCTGNQVLIGRDDGKANGLHWWVGCMTGPKIRFFLRQADGAHYYDAQGITTLTAEVWHHVVAMRDAGEAEIRLYVDGDEEVAVPATYTAGFGANAPINIGWLDSGGGYHFAGDMDEVALYARALTVDEIEQHYNNREGGPPYCSFPEVNSAISIDKVADLIAIQPEQVVIYTYSVTNPGEDPLSGVTVTDDKCSPVTYVSGDNSPHNDKLDLSETWIYTCSVALTVDTTNTATASGTDSTQATVQDQDTAFVDVIHPAIRIDKVADPTTIQAGEVVIYTYTVTNPGDDPLSTVGVSDDKCSPVVPIGGDANGNSKLDPGESWTYTCSADNVTEDTTNLATASGIDSLGGMVSDTATAFVDVIEDVQEFKIYLPVVRKD